MCVLHQIKWVDECSSHQIWVEYTVAYKCFFNLIKHEERRDQKKNAESDGNIASLCIMMKDKNEFKK